MSFIEEFQEFRKILCLCPCCGELVRVPDLILEIKGRPFEHTWLDNFETKMIDLGNKESKFKEKEEEIRKESIEKAQIGAKKAILKMMSPEMKALKLDPFDIKPISNPVDFVVYKGMTEKKDKVDEIMFLAKHINNSGLNKIRGQVKKAIIDAKYDWQVTRIDEDGKVTFE